MHVNECGPACSGLPQLRNWSDRKGEKGAQKEKPRRKGAGGDKEKREEKKEQE